MTSSSSQIESNGLVFFRNSEATEHPPRILKRPVSAFEGLVAPEVSGYLYAAKQALASFLEKAKGVGIRDRRLGLPYFVKHAKSWLKAREYEVHPSDKDGVMVIIQSSTMHELVMQQFQKHFYKPRSWLSVSVEFKHLKLIVSSSVACGTRLGW